MDVCGSGLKLKLNGCVPMSEVWMSKCSISNLDEGWVYSLSSPLSLWMVSYGKVHSLREV